LAGWLGENNCAGIKYDLNAGYGGLGENED